LIDDEISGLYHVLVWMSCTMPPSPKNLILNLLLAADGQALDAADAVTSCALFGIRENSARVTLVRLAAAGLIESAGRGAYRLGTQAADLAEDLSRWRSAESRTCDWHGGWIMVSTGELGRSDRTAMRHRQRALALLGFRALNTTLHVRPDNLVGHASGARERLGKLGLEEGVPVFTATNLAPELEALARGLWHGEALSQAYVQTQRKLEAWMTNASELDLETAAREAYLLGHEAIRQLVFDPLLPAPLVDVAARQTFTETVIRFDETGRRIWRQLLPSLQGHKRPAIVTARPLLPH
jgi:phenylacetic acid degradation operon negative regulatory protein